MGLIVCRSPINDQVIAERPTLSAAAITAAVDAARAAQRDWARRPISERGATMLRFLEAMRDANPEIVPELARQTRSCATRQMRVGSAENPHTNLAS